MQLRALAIAAALVCGVAFTVHAQGVPIPQLDTDANNDGLPDGWSRYVSDGTARTAVDADVKHSDPACLRVEIDADSRCTVTHLVTVPEPGDYMFGCWLKTDLPANAQSHLYVQWRNAKGEIIKGDRPSARLEGVNDWAEAVAFATRPEGADRALLVIVVQGPGAGTVWADEPYLREGSPPAPPAPEPVPMGECLQNPGFEAGAEQPEGWGKAIYGDGFTLSRDATEAHTGAASAKLDASETPGSRACYLQVGAVVRVEKAVRLRLWYKGSGRAEGILRFRPAPGAEAPNNDHGSVQFTCGLPRDEWTEQIVEAAVPKGARDHGQARVELILYQKAQGTVWYDDVTLESLAEWTPKLTAAQTALTMPNRPEDGRVVLQNPPDFSWTPQPMKESYTFQLSRDRDFADASTISADELPFNVYTHPTPLAEGDWHWRVRYFDEAGEPSEWTKARQFTVTDKAKPFVCPRPEDLLASIPQGHPRVYATSETLAAFRAPMLDTRKDWWETFQRAIDGYAQRPVDPEPGPEFANYAAGGLTDEKLKVGNGLRSYCGGVTSRTQQLAFGYLLSGDMKYAKAAIAQMLEMATWDPNGTTSYSNHDQVFRDITWKMACGYDWCWDAMTDDERTTIREAVVTRARQLYAHFSESARPIYEYPYDSHGITAYGFLGVCAIALAHESEDADEWFEFIAATYPAVFPPWGGEEGGWCQGVGYWKWSSPFAWWFFDALKSATGVDMYQKAWQRNDGWYKIYMHPPWCDRHHFGDGNHGAPGTTDQENLAHLAHVYENPYFQWYAKNLPGWPAGGIYSYWWYDEDLPIRPPADVPQGAYFPDIGWVAMHSEMSDPDDVMLMFKSSQFGSFNHSHADQNSFVVYAYGEPLLIDSGYYDWYGSPHDVGWTRQTKAHNDILVNGEGQPIFDKSATGTITAHFTSPDFDYARGDATVSYKGKLDRFERHILYLRPDLFVILDELEAPQASEFTWCMHAEEQMELRPESNEVIITRGGAKCLVKFVAPQALDFEQSDQFTPPSVRPLKDEWHVYAKTREKSKTVTFMTVIRPYRAADGVDPVSVDTYEDEELLHALVGEGTAYERAILQGAGPDEWVESDGTRLKARFIGVVSDGSRFVMVDGTALEIETRGGYETLLAASAPVTATLSAGARPDGRGYVNVHCLCAEETRLSLAAPDAARVRSVVLDGAELSTAEYSLADNKLTVGLAPGYHAIEVNPAPEPAGPQTDLELRLDDEVLPMDVETMATFDGGSLSWGSFTSSPGPVSAVAPGNAVVQIGRQTIGEGPVTWLTGNDAVTVRTAAPGMKVSVRLRSLLAEATPLEALIADESIAESPAAVKYEAETYTDDGDGSARVYSHREFLSGGKGVETAVVPGQWIKWELDVPEAGTYHLVCKGAVFEAFADRLIELDGEPLTAEHRLHRFPFTGGFGATPAEWKHMVVCGDDGEPMALTLDAGRHTLKITLAGGKLNLDYLMLVRQP